MRRSWELWKRSWHLLRKDSELAWIPLLGLLWFLLVMGSAFAGSIGVASVWDSSAAALWILAGIILVMVFLVGPLGTVLRAVTVAAALERHGGGDPTLRSAWRAVRARFGAVYAWALLQAFFGGRRNWEPTWKKLVIPMLLTQEMTRRETVKAARALSARDPAPPGAAVLWISLGLSFGLCWMLGLLYSLIGLLDVSESVPAPWNIVLGVSMAVVPFALLIYGLCLGTVMSSIHDGARFHFLSTAKVPEGYTEMDLVRGGSAA